MRDLSASGARSTDTPPRAGSIRTSRPSTTRCSPPSCQRLARSGPNARNRSVENAKSYGAGIASSGTRQPRRTRNGMTRDTAVAPSGVRTIATRKTRSLRR